MDNAENFFTVSIAASTHASKLDSAAKPSPASINNGCSLSTT
jgi:hypothetical protein